MEQGENQKTKGAEHMNPEIIIAAAVGASAVVGYVIGDRRRARLDDAELLRTACKLQVASAELAETKTRRHNAAVKGAMTKRATRIQLPKLEGERA
jgi:ADP-ribosylglycohydrolase